MCPVETDCRARGDHTGRSFVTVSGDWCCSDPLLCARHAPRSRRPARRGGLVGNLAWAAHISAVSTWHGSLVLAGGRYDWSYGVLLVLPLRPWSVMARGPQCVSRDCMSTVVGSVVCTYMQSAVRARGLIRLAALCHWVLCSASTFCLRFLISLSCALHFCLLCSCFLLRAES